MALFVISLTSTPPRFTHLPRFFMSTLARQSVKPDKVELNIARNYRRFPGALPSLPPLPDWVDVHFVDDDLGPATKILPTVARWREADPNILYCDDDQRYESGWLSRFADARRAKPDVAICEQGGDNERRAKFSNLPRARLNKNNGKDLSYRLQRILSFGLRKPPVFRFAADGYVDIMQGFGGVCVRPSFFPPESWRIPDIMWTEDDMWLSGMMEINQVGIWLHSKGARPFSERAPSRLDPLSGFNREGARKRLDYMQATYGIWPQTSPACESA